MLPSKEEGKKSDIVTGGEDLPGLETGEQAAQRQKGQGLKIMTPS